MPHRSPIHWAAALSLVIATCALCAWLFFHAAARETRQTAAGFAEAVRQALNLTPKISVDHTVIFQENTPVLELVASKQQFQHRMQWSSTWLGSTKAIDLEGTFTASVGFDLHEPFSVEFNSRKQTVVIRHPRPRILSVQLDSVKTSQDPGWWNSITDADRSEVLTRFTADARAKMEKATPLLDKTRQDLRRQLGDLLVKSGLAVEFREAPEPAAPASRFQFGKERE